MSDKRKLLTNGEKQAAIKAGLIIQAGLFYDSAGPNRQEIRKQALADGGTPDMKVGYWVFPDSPTYVKYAKLVGVKVESVKVFPESKTSPVVTVPVGSNGSKAERPMAVTPAPQVTAVPSPAMQTSLPGIVPPPPITPLPVEAKPEVQLPPQPQLPKSKKQIIALRPSILVIYGISLDADVTYQHLDDKTETTEDEEEGTRDVKKTATVQTEIHNEEEHQATKALRSQMYGILRKLGSKVTGSALLVDVDREAELDTAITEVEKLAYEHNAKARNHFIRPVVTPCAVLGTKAEKVAKEAAFDLQEMLIKMQRALDSCDEERLTSLATQLKVKALSLAPGIAQGTVNAAINDARKVAKVMRDVEKAVKSKEEQVVRIKAELKTKKLGTTMDSARMMFLDTFEIPEHLEQARASANAARFAGLETETPTQASEQKTNTSRFAGL